MYWLNSRWPTETSPTTVYCRGVATTSSMIAHRTLPRFLHRSSSGSRGWCTCKNNHQHHIGSECVPLKNNKDKKIAATKQGRRRTHKSAHPWSRSFTCLSLAELLIPSPSIPYIQLLIVADSYPPTYNNNAAYFLHILRPDPSPLDKCTATISLMSWNRRSSAHLRQAAGRNYYY